MTAVAVVLAMALGLGLMVASRRAERRQRERAIDELLDMRILTSTAEDDPSPSVVVARAVELAGQAVDRVDPKRSLAGAIERARIPMRPGEFVIVTISAGLGVAALLLAVTGSLLLGVAGLLAVPLAAGVFVRFRANRRRRAFEAELPDALSLVASSLAAGHTFLRAIQMMCEEASPPLSEEFARVVAETRLGDPVVEALARMAERLQVRDLEWVVQAIRIQQTVGGRLADLLHTLSDFIRARDEVRREVKVLTAEGRISAWVLAALVPFLLAVIQVLNPEYVRPLYSGWGLAVLGLSALSVGVGTLLILRMVKIDV